jgi:hypothetical protein
MVIEYEYDDSHTQSIHLSINKTSYNHKFYMFICKLKTLTKAHIRSNPSKALEAKMVIR